MFYNPQLVLLLESNPFKLPNTLSGQNCRQNFPPFLEHKMHNYYAVDFVGINLSIDIVLHKLVDLSHQIIELYFYKLFFTESMIFSNNIF